MNKVKDIVVAGGPVLKQEEDQDPGFLLLLTQLAPVLVLVLNRIILIGSIIYKSY